MDVRGGHLASKTSVELKLSRRGVRPTLQKAASLVRVSWTQRKTNECVLLELGEKRQLLKDIKTRKIRYYGNVKRKDSCLEKDIIQGHVNGRRSAGRQRRRWVEDITEWTGLQINQAVRVTEDRQQWHNVLCTTNPLGGRH